MTNWSPRASGGTIGRIVRPLLIAPGSEDVREGLGGRADCRRNAETPCSRDLLHYPDEGHDSRRLENHRSFATAAEAFLATHLGERREPVGEGFRSSTIEFRTGRELVPGLN